MFAVIDIMKKDMQKTKEGKTTQHASRQGLEGCLGVS